MQNSCTWFLLFAFIWCNLVMCIKYEWVFSFPSGINHPHYHPIQCFSLMFVLPLCQRNHRSVNTTLRADYGLTINGMHTYIIKLILQLLLKDRILHNMAIVIIIYSSVVLFVFIHFSVNDMNTLRLI